MVGVLLGAPRARALTAVSAAVRGDRGVLPRTPDDWHAFLGCAAAHDLLPAVWVGQHRAGELTMSSSLATVLEQEAPAGRTVPEAVVRRAYDRNVERVQRLVDHGVEVLTRLEAAGIRAVPLKGLHSVLAGIWSDAAARTMADLDVLVDATRATRAFDLLRSAGYAEHPEPIGEHADHHLPMLCQGDVTVELHVEPLVSRWRELVPATRMLERATHRPTTRGVLLLADDTDAFVHLVAHAQLQEETYTLLGLPLRALLETARVPGDAIRWDEVRACFSRAGVAHVLDAHLAEMRHWLGPGEIPAAATVPTRRAAAHVRLVEAGVAEPALVAAWTYAVRVPRSFTTDRMHAEFGPGGGASWLWRARARHAVRRLRQRAATASGRRACPHAH